MVFYMPESNYPPFCGASSEVTDRTVTKYCHPGKPFSIQQGGFFLSAATEKGLCSQAEHLEGVISSGLSGPALGAAVTRPSGFGVGNVSSTWQLLAPKKHPVWAIAWAALGGSSLLWGPGSVFSFFSHFIVTASLHRVSG